jgi:hypothetical protein
MFQRQCDITTITTWCLQNNATSKNPVPVGYHLQNIALPLLKNIFDNINLSISLETGRDINMYFSE